jgi:hypothetical protein
MKIRCHVCNGAKYVRGDGYMEHDCTTCNATGLIEKKIEVEIVTNDAKEVPTESVLSTETIEQINCEENTSDKPRRGRPKIKKSS